MVAMTLVIVVGVIAVIAAVIARTTWRRTADERHSVKDYQHTVETMRHLAERRSDARRPAPTPGRRPPQPGSAGASRRRTIGSSNATARHPGPGARVGAAGGRPAPAPARPASPTRREERPPHPSSPARAPVAKVDAGRRPAMVFVDDARPTAAAGEPGADVTTSPPRPVAPGTAPGGPRRVAVGRAQLGGRPWLTIAAGIVAVGGAIALALSFSPSHPTLPTHGAKHHAPARTTPATTKTVPPGTVVTPVAQTPRSATYRTSTTPFEVVLTASGPCWVRATETTTGSVLWTGTLASGERQALPATGQVLVELGAPDAVAVSLNGKPVRLPSGFQAPLDLTFRTS